MADAVTASQVNDNHKGDNQYVSRSLSYGRTALKQSYGQQYNTAGNQSNNQANSMAFLSQGMHSMNFQESPYNAAARGHSMSGTSGSWSGYNMANAIPAPFWTTNSTMMLPGQQIFNPNGNAVAAAMYTPSTAQYITHGYGQTHDNSPMSQGWTPTGMSGEVPTLITPRRESISSADNDTPGTPVYPTYHAMTQGGITILNRSPSGAYTTSSPSPLQVLAGYGMPLTKVPEIESISPRLKMLVTKDPSIPPAIPAPSSPLKPLDRALENTRGETNVYIRGLMPETSDELLDGWGRRFGDIKSSKSIIDHNTGLCKGSVSIRATFLLPAYSPQLRFCQVPQLQRC